MIRLNKIYRNQTYQILLKKLKQLETDRIYCKHDEEHFLSVARSAYIKCLEQSIPVSKELLYCAAFLHDIGKSDQYTNNIPHEIASQKYAAEILQEEGFLEAEIAFILKLIEDHRSGPKWHSTSDNMETSDDVLPKGLKDIERISMIFYQADKQSRNCFCCKETDTCNWSDDKKNLAIK